MEIRKFDSKKLKSGLAGSIVSFLLDTEIVYKNRVLSNYLSGLYDGFDYTDEIMGICRESMLPGNVHVFRLVEDLCDTVKNF